MGIAAAILGLGAGLLLGRLLELRSTPAQRLVTVGGVAAVLTGGLAVLLGHGFDDAALGVGSGLLLALATGLVTRLGAGLHAGSAARRPRDGCDCR